MRVLAKQAAHGILNGRHTRHAADQDDLINVFDRQLGIFQGATRRHNRALDQVAGQLLQLRPREGHRQVLRPAGIGRDERQVDLGLHHGRKLDLGLLARFLETLQRHAVLAQVNALLFLVLVGDPVHHALIEVIAAQEGIAIGGEHLEDAVAHIQNRDVERTAAQVIDHNLLVLLLVQAIGKGGGGRFIDDAQDIEAGDLARIFGGLALAIVEIGRHRNDRLGHRLAQISLGIGLELLQDHGRNLWR